MPSQSSVARDATIVALPSRRIDFSDAVSLAEAVSLDLKRLLAFDGDGELLERVTADANGVNGGRQD